MGNLCLTETRLVYVNDISIEQNNLKYFLFIIVSLHGLLNICFQWHEYEPIKRLLNSITIMIISVMTLPLFAFSL